MTQVNLLPSEVRERQKTRRVTTAIGAGAGVAVVLLGFVFVVQSSRLTSAQHQLTLQQSTNQRLQSQISGLQRYQDLKQQVSDKQAVVTEITTGEIQWSGVLRDLSMVIPGDVWMNQVTGTAATTPGSTTTVANAAPGSNLVGQLQFTGSTLDHPSVALWLTRLTKANGWVNPWVTTSSKSGGLVSFTGSVDFTSEVTSGGRQ